MIDCQPFSRIVGFRRYTGCKGLLEKEMCIKDVNNSTIFAVIFTYIGFISL